MVLRAVDTHDLSHRRGSFRLYLYVRRALGIPNIRLTVTPARYPPFFYPYPNPTPCAWPSRPTRIPRQPTPCTQTTPRRILAVKIIIMIIIVMNKDFTIVLCSSPPLMWHIFLSKAWLCGRVPRDC